MINFLIFHLNCISLITITVATAQTSVAPYFVSTMQVDNGKRNSKSPVSLFPNECSINNLCAFLLAIIMPVTLITAMITVHIQIQYGTDRNGSILTAYITAKIKSAMLSSLAPFSLSVCSFRARKPSSTSVTPHNKYSTAKGTEDGERRNRQSENRILLTVIQLAITALFLPPFQCRKQSFSFQYHILLFDFPHIFNNFPFSALI